MPSPHWLYRLGQTAPLLFVKCKVFFQKFLVESRGMHQLQRMLPEVGASLPLVSIVSVLHIRARAGSCGEFSPIER